VARALPAPRQTRTSSGPRRSRGPRVPERRRDMMARAGRRLRLAVRPVIRAVKMARNEQMHAWECILLTSGAAPLTAAGPLRWVPSLNGDRLAAATCRPKTRPKRGGNPGWRPRAKIPAPAIGGRTPGHTTADLLTGSRPSTPAQGATRVRPARAHHLHLPPRRRQRTPAAVRRQLTKSESRPALRSDLFVAHQSHVRCHLGDQTGQAPCRRALDDRLPRRSTRPAAATGAQSRPQARRRRRPGRIPATRPERWYGSRPHRRAGQGRGAAAGGRGHGLRLGRHKESASRNG
jgi:hypothetical protein